MNRLVLLFVDICRLRRGPQDVPYSDALMALALAVYLLSGFFVLVIEQSAFAAAAQTGVDTAVLGVVAWGLLRLRGYPQRFTQAFTALTGTGALIQLASLLPSWLFLVSGHQGHVAALLLVALLVWNIAVLAHIMRHALSTRLAVGVLSALTYTYLSYQALVWLFPPVK